MSSRESTPATIFEAMAIKQDHTYIGKFLMEIAALSAVSAQKPEVPVEVTEDMMDLELQAEEIN